MIKQFGHTWWGKQWLNSFNHIDNSNRLPRGKSYARKGRTHSIAIQGNTVTAKVDGSARCPYRVSVSVTSFTKQEKETILETITDNPLGRERRHRAARFGFQLIIALKQICNHPVQYLKRGKAKIDLSGKATRLMELLDDLYEQGEKVLIFTQFREMSTLLQQFIGETYHMITEGTSEEKINRMLIEKRELADLAVSQGEQWIGELSDQDLKGLFTL